MDRPPQPGGGPTCAPPGAAPGFLYTFAALAFIAHSLEEAAGLVAWRSQHPLPFVPAATQPQFVGALAWLTIAALAIYLAGRMAQFAGPVQVAVAALAGGLVVNAASHAALSLATMSIMPGLWTALLGVAPLNLWLLARMPLGLRERLFAAFSGAVLMPVVTTIALRLNV